MKVALLNYSNTIGGAARAAYRLHHALRLHGVESRMYVASAGAQDWTVQLYNSGWMSKIDKFRAPLARLLTNVLSTKSRALHSPNIFPSRWPHYLNHSDADVVHLHLMADEMMSIADVGWLRKPAVWTLHDMWGFCGAEHFTEDYRWRDGYTQHNRPAYESGFDLNRWTWRRKLRHWRRPMHIVAPSRWLADCVRQSAIMQNWPVTVVPNAIDTEAWHPIDKMLARKILNLPGECPLLLFGAADGTRDPRKGFDLLRSALDHLRGEMADLQLVIMGERAPKEPLNLGFPIHYTGHLWDDISLRLFYCAADAVVLPSRQDNLPNCGVEAHACGTPVVAFDACGLPDIIEHQKTGYLARHFDAEDLARGIQWVLGDTDRHATLSRQSREAAVSRYSFPVVAEQYLKVYEATVC